MGINEEVLRGDKPAPSDGKKVCWWAKCDTKEKEEDTPYKRCSGCHAVTCVLSLACRHYRLVWARPVLIRHTV
jgi:hypothetical protein